MLLLASLVGPTTPEAQLALLTAEIAQLPDFREISTVPLEGDSQGFAVRFDWSLGGAPYRSDIDIHQAGARVFALWAGAPVGVYDQVQPSLDRVMDSFGTTLPASLEPLNPDVPLVDTLDVIEDRVSRVRELAAAPELERRFQTREDFIAESQRIDDETRMKTEVDKDFCVVMDLCAPSDDLLQLLVDLTGEAVLGFYEIGEGSLTVVEDTGPIDPKLWLTYAHEYTHAVQDQDFDLPIIPLADETSFDLSRAVRAVLEGDANLTEYLFYETLPADQQMLLGELVEQQATEFSQSPALEQVPRIIRQTFGWEHRAGTQFVLRLYVEGGFDAIDRAFSNPPRSTEQIMEPEKYFGREEPHPVELPDLARALGGTWQERDRAVMGQLLTGVYLGTFVGDGVGAQAAQGWGGDQYSLLKDADGRLAMVVLYSWDTLQDATEFFDVYLDFVDQKSEGRWELVESAATLRLWVGDGISVFLAREGSRTLLVIGPDQGTVDSLRQAAQG